MSVDVEILADTLQEELIHAAELWNPQLLSVEDWELEVPVASGVAVRLYTVDGNEHYELQTMTATFGDLDVSEDTALETISNVVAEQFSFANRIDIDAFDGEAICLPIPYDAVEDATETVELRTDWGDDPLQINVPAEIEDTEDYALTAAERMAYQNINQVLDEVAESHPRNPSFRIQE